MAAAGIGLAFGISVISPGSAAAATWDSPITTVYPGQSLTVTGTCEAGVNATKPLQVYFSGVGYPFVVLGVGPGGSQNQTLTVTIPSNALSAGNPRLSFQCFDAGGDTTSHYNVTVVPTPIDNPRPWLKAIGRPGPHDACPPGTSASWAEWPDEGRGGWTCEWHEGWSPHAGDGVGGFVSLPGFPGGRIGIGQP